MAFFISGAPPRPAIRENTVVTKRPPIAET
jgi:hypothetical protein